MKEGRRKFNRNQRYLMLSLIPLYFIACGFVIDPMADIANGLRAIIYEPDFLITDYMVVGGIGAAFLNAGLLMLISILFCYALGLTEEGHTITASCLMFGFSLFGKNLVNIWAILAGVFLYALFHRTHPSKYIYVGLYGTSLSPIITQLMYATELPFWGRVAVSVGTGLFIGFILPPLSAHVHQSHQGYSLYNVGFAGGIAATVVVSVMKSFGYESWSRLIWLTGHNQELYWILSIFFWGMMILPLLTGPDETVGEYMDILKRPGLGGTDYLRDEGGRAVMFNMGVNGYFSMMFLLLVGGDLNGPTIGGIFTIVGFSATGKHLRNIMPVIAGVALSSRTGFWEVNSPSAQLALLFGSTLAPIAGEFGILAGVLAGFLHAAVVMQVGTLYAGMNLYNNGFAGGIVAIFMVPVMQSIRTRRQKARSEDSL